jgi:prophage regulatory protein
MSILRMPAVKAETGNRSHASIYTAIHAGLFTMPVLIGQRSVGWPSDEVQAINAARISGKSDTAIRALVEHLHAARCAGTGEAFKPTWLDKSAEVKKQALKRTKRTPLATA